MSHGDIAINLKNGVRLPRGGIVVSGVDAATFLQGLISNDMNVLTECTAPVLYAAFLTPQGKFLHDALIYPYREGFLIETQENPRAADLVKHLEKYRLRAKVEVAPLQITVWAGWGETPAGAIVVRDPRHPDLGWRCVIPVVHDAAPPCDDTPAPFAIYDRHRIKLGVPDGDRDAEIGVSTLEELNIPRLNGVSFTKGCYVGQELTARMEHRGLAKRHLRTVYVNALPEGAVLRSSCEDIGLALVRD